MGGPDHARAGDDHRGVERVDLEHLEGGARADDVDDGVEATDLVEVDLLRRTPVEAALGLGQRAEHRQRSPPDPLRQTGLLDQRRDVRRRAHDRRLLHVHVGLGGRDAAAQHRLGLEAPAPHREPLDHRAHLVDVGPRVEQRPQRHVPGDPGEAVEPRDPRHRLATSTSGDARGVAHLSIRSTAQAAP